MLNTSRTHLHQVLSPTDLLSSLAATHHSLHEGRNSVALISAQLFSTDDPTRSLLLVRLTPDIPSYTKSFEQLLHLPRPAEHAHRELSSIFSRFPRGHSTETPFVSMSEFRDLIDEGRRSAPSSSIDETPLPTGMNSSPSLPTIPLRFPKVVLSSFDDLLCDSLRYAIQIEWHQKVLADIEILRGAGLRPAARLALHMRQGADIVTPLPHSPFADLSALAKGVAEITHTAFSAVQNELDTGNDIAGASRILEALGDSLGIPDHVSTLLPPPLFDESTFRQMEGSVPAAAAEGAASTLILRTYSQRLDHGGLFQKPIMNVMIVGGDSDSQLFRLQITVQNLRSLAGCDDYDYLRSQVATWLSHADTRVKFLVSTSTRDYPVLLRRALERLQHENGGDTGLAFGVLPHLTVYESDPYVSSTPATQAECELRVSLAEALLNHGTPISGSRFDTAIAQSSLVGSEANLVRAWRVQVALSDTASFLYFQNGVGGVLSLSGEGLLLSDSELLDSKPIDTPQQGVVDLASAHLPREHLEAASINRLRAARAEKILSLASMLDASTETILEEAEKLGLRARAADIPTRPSSCQAYDHAGSVAAAWLLLLQSEAFVTPSEARALLRKNPGQLFSTEFLDDGRCLLQIVAEAGPTAQDSSHATRNHTICINKDGVQSVWLTSPAQNPVAREFSSVVRSLTQRGIHLTKSGGGAFSRQEVTAALRVLAEPRSTSEIREFLREEAPAITLSEHSLVTRSLRERLTRWFKRRWG